VWAGGPLKGLFEAIALGPWVSRQGNKKLASLSHQPNRDDLVYVAGLMEAGKVKPVIDRCFPLEETAEAFLHCEAGQSRNHRGRGQQAATRGLETTSRLLDEGGE
jgi:NADPH:quinone reductase-like Zn-dependent oxidoreductase